MNFFTIDKLFLFCEVQKFDNVLLLTPNFKKITFKKSLGNWFTITVHIPS